MKATGLPQFQQEIRRILRLFDERVQWRPAGSKAEPADLASGDVAQHRKRCLGLGADRVVGIGIDCTDDTRSVDDESRRYGKLPCCIPRVLRQIEAEALVSSFEIIRQCEQEAKRPRNVEVRIPDNRELEFLLVSHALRNRGRFGREYDEFATRGLHVSVDGLQSLQLCAAVGSPMPSEEREHEWSNG